jgi:hypothetical protein
MIYASTNAKIHTDEDQQQHAATAYVYRRMTTDITVGQEDPGLLSMVLDDASVWGRVASTWSTP